MVDVSGIFNFLFCFGGGEREEEFEAKKGGTFYWEIEGGGGVSEEGTGWWTPRLGGLSAPKSQRFLRFAIAMPIVDPRNRAISETRASNVALRFKGAMESR